MATRPHRTTPRKKPAKRTARAKVRTKEELAELIVESLHPDMARELLATARAEQPPADWRAGAPELGHADTSLALRGAL